MSLLAALPEIDKQADTVFVMHEKSERHFPFHKHTKGQLTYIEGGLAYLSVVDKTYVIPAMHYFWIPAGVSHILRIGPSATIMRSIFFYTNDDGADIFYSRIGIHPVNDLLAQMIKFSGRWQGHIQPGDKSFPFLQAIKNTLPLISASVLPIVLPSTENPKLQEIIAYMEGNLAGLLSLTAVGHHFYMSERSLSRLFHSKLGVSYLQYVKTLRMAKSLSLITQNQHSLSEISYMVGYQSLSAFSNSFYQFTNFRPSDFINRQKEYFDNV